MRAYVKAIGTSNVTLVDIDSGERFSAGLAAIQKLFGVELKEGDVWEFYASKRDDIAENFKRWQLVQQA
ncbi:MAG: hypothetical protein ACP5RN_01420 [Armatimonadota bacterium]